MPLQLYRTTESIHMPDFISARLRAGVANALEERHSDLMKMPLWRKERASDGNAIISPVEIFRLWPDICPKRKGQ